MSEEIYGIVCPKCNVEVDIDDEGMRCPKCGKLWRRENWYGHS